MRFQIDYLDSEGNVCHYWTDALTKHEAEKNLYDNTHDVDSILTIRSK